MLKLSMTLIIALGLIAAGCNSATSANQNLSLDIPSPTTDRSIGQTPSPTDKPVPSTKPTSNPTKSNCNPNYSGCVPIASDVDCAGGSGNGPAYTRGPVNVIGYDIYGLDRDGDGIACE